MNAKCDGKMHLGLGYVCMSVLTRRMLAKEALFSRGNKLQYQQVLFVISCLVCGLAVT